MTSAAQSLDRLPAFLAVQRVVTLIASIVLLVAGCGSDDGGSAAPATTRAVPAPTAEETAPPDTAPADTEPSATQPAGTEPPATGSNDTEPPATEAGSATTTLAPVEPVQVLVTNDDGIDAPGLDALVVALLELPDTEVTVVAPAENQSGTAMSLTEGDLATTDAQMAGGYPAVAVDGFPADSVAWALSNLDVGFDLVVSGSNSGQNIGPFTELSGTVGAARYAAQQGIPGVAVSQGLVEGDIVFTDSVTAAIDWIRPRLDDYLAGEVTLTGINAATCDGGNRGVVEVPVATDFGDREPFVFDCASTLEDPVDDVDAFVNGFTAISELPIQP